MADRLRLLCAGQQARSWPSASLLGPHGSFSDSFAPAIRHFDRSSLPPFVTPSVRHSRPFVTPFIDQSVRRTTYQPAGLAAALRGGRLLSDPLLLREIIDVTLNDRSVMRRGGLLQGRGKTPPGVVRPTGFPQQSAAGTGE